MLDSDGKPAAKAVVVLNAVDPRGLSIVEFKGPLADLTGPITNSELDGSFVFNVPAGRYTAFATMSNGPELSAWQAWQKKLAWEENVDVAAHERQVGMD